MKMRSISNDEYVFGSPVRDGPKEDEVKRRKSIAKKMIKEAIDHNPPFKDFLEANHFKNQFYKPLKIFKIMAADFNLDAKMQEQENNQGKVNTSAVDKAKENIAAKKLEQETREVERRLSNAESTEDRALKELRMARKKEEAQKAFLTAVSTAKTKFESDGDYRAYDKAVEEAEEKRDKAVSDAKRAIYGEDYWRY